MRSWPTGQACQPRPAAGAAQAQGRSSIRGRSSDPSQEGRLWACIASSPAADSFLVRTWVALWQENRHVLRLCRKQHSATARQRPDTKRQMLCRSAASAGLTRSHERRSGACSLQERKPLIVSETRPICHYYSTRSSPALHRKLL